MGDTGRQGSGRVFHLQIRHLRKDGVVVTYWYRKRGMAILVGSYGRSLLCLKDSKTVLSHRLSCVDKVPPRRSHPVTVVVGSLKVSPSTPRPVEKEFHFSLLGAEDVGRRDKSPWDYRATNEGDPNLRSERGGPFSSGGTKRRR